MGEKCLAGELLCLSYLLILFAGNCPTGWINAVGTNDCYLFARNGPGVTWTQAKYYCISVGGNLAEITDQRSQDFVRRYGDPNIFWWLGGYKESNVSVYYLWDLSNPIFPVISLSHSRFTL